MLDYQKRLVFQLENQAKKIERLEKRVKALESERSDSRTLSLSQVSERRTGKPKTADAKP